MDLTNAVEMDTRNVDAHNDRNVDVRSDPQVQMQDKGQPGPDGTQHTPGNMADDGHGVASGSGLKRGPDSTIDAITAKFMAAMKQHQSDMMQTVMDNVEKKLAAHEDKQKRKRPYDDYGSDYDNDGGNDDGGHDSDDEEAPVPPKRTKRAHEISDEDDVEGDGCDLIDKLGALIDSDKKETSGGGEDPLQEYTQDLGFDAVEGPEVMTAVADILQDLATKKLPDDKMKDKMNSIKSPSNCPSLVTAKVNTEVWSQLKPATRSRDLRLQRLQMRIVNSLGPLAYAVEAMVKAQQEGTPLKGEELKQALRCCLDSYTMGASALQEINMRRKEMIRPDLNTKFQQLCKTPTPCGPWLFGDDLGKAVREIHDTSRMGYDLAGKKHAKGARFHGYKGKGKFSPQSGHGPKNGPYKGSGGPGFRRQNQNHNPNKYHHNNKWRE